MHLSPPVCDPGQDSAPPLGPHLICKIKGLVSMDGYQGVVEHPGIVPKMWGGHFPGVRD